MYSDEIVTEMWLNRDAYLEEYHHRLEEIVNDLRLRQKKRRERVVDHKPHMEIQQTADRRS